MMWIAMLALLQAGAGPELTGDFDRDGVDDRAYFVSAPGRVDLMMQPGRDGAPAVKVLEMADPGNIRFWVAEPGTYRTACGMGIGDNAGPCAADKVTLSGPTIAFGDQEATMAVAIWNGADFDTVWLSD